MLLKTCAHLDNTQGKMAKWKTRERQLEEAGRLAVLQRKRSLVSCVSSPSFNLTIQLCSMTRVTKTKLKGKKSAPRFYDASEE